MKPEVDIWVIFKQFPDTAPKNIDELIEFEIKCRNQKKVELAEWLYEWRLELEFHKEREHDVGSLI